MHDLLRQFRDLTDRRRFVTRAAQAALGVSLLPSAAAAAAEPGGTARRVIYVFLEGAASQLETFDPKPGVAEQGETGAIGTKIPGVKFGEHLPQLARLLDRVAVVRSLTTETGAHQQGRYLMRTSYAEIATTRHPSMGAWLQQFQGRENKELPGAVRVGNSSRHPGAGFLSASLAPAPVPNPAAGLENTESPKYLTDEQFDKRMRLAARFDRSFQRRYPGREVKSYVEFYEEAVRLLKSKDLEAFDISKEPEAVRKKYGDTKLGQGCLLARRLVESGVRFVEVISGGWDQHRELFTKMPDKGAELDTSVAALLGDLQRLGMLDDTLVVVTTEFGRTPKINQNAGRDHHPGVFSSMLAGGGIRGGQVYGSSDETASSVDDAPVTPADFNATIAHALNLPLEQEVVSPVGRPFRVAHDGAPLSELF